MKINNLPPRLRAGWLLLCVLAPLAHAGIPGVDTYGVTASLDSEVVRNINGGIDDGSGASTLGYLGLWADLDGGGRLKAAGTAYYGNQPGGRYVGDFQGVSNIEAPRRHRLYELWYRQPVGEHWAVQLGLIPADNYFGVTESSGLLINSSFGAPGTWGDSIPAPIYPTAGVGAIVTWQSGGWSNRTGVFQTDPSDRGSALHRGALYLNEAGYSDERLGTYKIGIWDYCPHASQSIGLPTDTHGAWFSAQHALSANRERGPWGFLRWGLSPDRSTQVAREMQIGVLARSPFEARPNDQLSVGLTQVRLRDTGTENVWEATWLLSFGDHVSLQPDLQYVQHPSGNLDSAVVGILRLHIGLD